MKRFYGLFLIFHIFADLTEFVSEATELYDKSERDQDHPREQFSRLTFDTTTRIMDSVNLEEEKLNHSFWGRLYFDGFPGQSGIQYFRAHFGRRPPSKHVMFVLADPLDNCSTESNQTVIPAQLHGNETVLVAKRGNCSYAQKAQIAQDRGATGILFINNAEGNMFPSAQGMSGLSVSVTMIGKHHGGRLIQALQKQKKKQKHAAAIMGKYVPITCDTDDSDYCNPVMEQDAFYVEKFFSQHLTGTVSSSKTCRAMAHNNNNNNNNNDDEMEGTSTSTRSRETSYHYKYAQAEFGLRIEHGEAFTIARESLFNKMDFCNEIDRRTDDTSTSTGSMDETSSLYNSKAVLVHRGNCSFLVKAQNVASTGATMMIVVNDYNKDNDDGNDIFSMGIDNAYEGSKIHIAAIMISKASWEDLRGCDVSTVTLHPTTD